jgi:hypothetical protein
MFALTITGVILVIFTVPCFLRLVDDIIRRSSTLDFENAVSADMLVCASIGDECPAMALELEAVLVVIPSKSALVSRRGM